MKYARYDKGFGGEKFYQLWETRGVGYAGKLKWTKRLATEVARYCYWKRFVDEDGVIEGIALGLLIMIATTFSFTNLTDSTSYLYLVLMSTGRRIGMAMILMPVQTAGLNQLPAKLNAHGTAISNTVKQVAGAVGTSLLVSVMTNRTTAHLTSLATANTAGSATKEHLIMEASIQGINDAYLVIIGISIVGLLLSLFIKNTQQANSEQPETQTAAKVKKIKLKKA